MPVQETYETGIQSLSWKDPLEEEMATHLIMPVFSSTNFIVPSLTFRSLIHFEFIFVHDVKECSNFIFLQVSVQFSQYSY